MFAFPSFMIPSSDLSEGPHQSRIEPVAVGIFLYGRVLVFDGILLMVGGHSDLLGCSHLPVPFQAGPSVTRWSFTGIFGENFRALKKNNVAYP